MFTVTVTLIPTYNTPFGSYFPVKKMNDVKFKLYKNCFTRFMYLTNIAELTKLSSQVGSNLDVIHFSVQVVEYLRKLDHLQLILITTCISLYVKNNIDIPFLIYLKRRDKITIYSKRGPKSPLVKKSTITISKASNVLTTLF